MKTKIFWKFRGLGRSFTIPATTLANNLKFSQTHKKKLNAYQEFGDVSFH